jgi:hypothetical protein
MAIYDGAVSSSVRFSNVSEVQFNANITEAYYVDLNTINIDPDNDSTAARITQDDTLGLVFDTNADGTANISMAGNTVTATTFSGNASTATALAADPSDCTGAQFAVGVTASGAATCDTVQYSDLSGGVITLDADADGTVSTITQSDSSGTVFADASDFAFDSGSDGTTDVTLNTNGVTTSRIESLDTVLRTTSSLNFGTDSYSGATPGNITATDDADLSLCVNDKSCNDVCQDWCITLDADGGFLTTTGNGFKATQIKVISGSYEAGLTTATLTNNRSISMPDIAGTMILDTGTQTIGGTKTLSDALIYYHQCSNTASAATITVDGCNVVTLTGSTNVTTLNTCNTANKNRTLKILCGAYTGTITDGSNLKMAGNLACTSDDVLSLICDGTNWLETGRSVN